MFPSASYSDRRRGGKKTVPYLVALSQIWHRTGNPVVCLFLVMPLGLSAQQGATAGPECADWILPLESPLSAVLPPTGCRKPVDAKTSLWGGTSPGKSFLLSAALPGAGQYAQGQPRWILYAGAEVVGWLFWGRARSRAKSFRGDFETLAWETARIFDGDRIDGDWEYYEHLSNFTRSGQFDIDRTRAGVQPERDVTTFNGNAWRLARQLYFTSGSDPQPGDSDYEAALEFYRKRAAGREFEWDWTGLDAERASFDGLIRDSDSAFHDASLLGGGIALNHILSGLDAFLSSRITAMADLPIRFTTRWDPGIRGGFATFAWGAAWRIK